MPFIFQERETCAGLVDFSNAHRTVLCNIKLPKRPRAPFPLSDSQTITSPFGETPIHRKYFLATLFPVRQQAFIQLLLHGWGEMPHLLGRYGGGASEGLCCGHRPHGTVGTAVQSAFRPCLGGLMWWSWARRHGDQWEEEGVGGRRDRVGEDPTCACLKSVGMAGTDSEGQAVGLWTRWTRCLQSVWQRLEGNREVGLGPDPGRAGQSTYKVSVNQPGPPGRNWRR